MAIDPNLSPEKLKEALEYLTKIKDVQETLRKYAQDPATEATFLRTLEHNRKIAEVYLEQNAQLEKLIKQTEKLRKKAKDEGDAVKQKALAEKKKRLQDLKKTAESYTKLKKRLGDFSVVQEKLNKVMRKGVSFTDRYRKSNERWSKTMKTGADGVGAIETAVNVGKGAIAGFTGGLNSMTKELAVLSMVAGRPFITYLQGQFMKLFAEYDKGFTDIFKKGFTFREGMEQIFDAALDPVAGRELTGMDNTFSRMLTRMGIKATEISAAFVALKKNAMFFTSENIKANKAFTAEVTNLYAGLSKLGVNFTESASAFDVFSKVIKQAPRSALKSTKKLIKLADSLDISTGEAFQNFNKLMPNLSMYGERAIEVFGELAAQARATGIEMGGLAKFAEGLDTFKGAARVAQGLNAILGDTYLSVTDLAAADPAEKISMIRDAFTKAGVDFANLTGAQRRVQQSVAALFGRDVGYVRRIFGSEEDYKKVSAGMSTSAASSEEIKKKLMRQMTTAERATRVLQDLNGGIGKLIRTGHKFADQVSNTVTATIAGVGQEIDKTSGKVKQLSSDLQVLAFGAMLKGVAGAAKVKSALAKAATAGAFIRALGPQGREAVAGQLQAELKDLGTFTLEALKAAAEEVGIDLSQKQPKQGQKGGQTRSFAELKREREERFVKAQAELASSMNVFVKQFKNSPLVLNSTLELDGDKLAEQQRKVFVDLVNKMTT